MCGGWLSSYANLKQLLMPATLRVLAFDSFFWIVHRLGGKERESQEEGETQKANVHL